VPAGFDLGFALDQAENLNGLAPPASARPGLGSGGSQTHTGE